MSPPPAHAEALQIISLDMQANKVEVNEENLSRISKNLVASGADLVSIVAIMGTYRTGKSFLLDLIIKYLRRIESSRKAAAKKAPEGWQLEDGRGIQGKEAVLGASSGSDGEQK